MDILNQCISDSEMHRRLPNHRCFPPFLRLNIRFKTANIIYFFLFLPILFYIKTVISRAFSQVKLVYA